jgi:hypothetical protein
MDSQDRELTGIEARARDAFRATVESLDGSTRARLVAARRAAVAEVRQPRVLPWRTWGPVAAMASVALVAVLLWRMQGSESPTDADVIGAHVAATDPAAADTALAPVELLANGDDLGLVENDLVFYEWLDATGFEVADSSG